MEALKETIARIMVTLTELQNQIAPPTQQDHPIEVDCELCDFSVASEPWLSVHMNRRHGSVPQVDGMDEGQDEERDEEREEWLDDFTEDLEDTVNEGFRTYKIAWIC